MVDCFVVSKSTDDFGAIYEFSGGTISLVNNRHFKEAANSISDARTIVEGRAPKFFSGPVSKIEQIDLKVGVYHPSIARPTYPSLCRGLENLNVASEAATIARG